MPPTTPTYPCEWPADGHPPHDNLPASICGIRTSGHTLAYPTIEHTCGLRVCITHGAAALNHGWKLRDERTIDDYHAAAERQTAPRSVPDARSRPLFRPGDEPRGLLTRSVAYTALGVMVAGALAGDLWDRWATHRARRQITAALRRMEARR